MTKFLGQLEIRSIRNSSCERGSVLLLALLILSTVLASSIAVGTLVVKEIRSNRQLDDAVVSYYAAESGIEKGLWTARKNPTAGTGSSAIALPNAATISLTAVNKGEAIVIPFLAKGSTTQVDVYNPEGSTTGNLGANIDTLHIKKDGPLVVAGCKERVADGTFADCGGAITLASDAVTGLDPAKAYRLTFRADGDAVRSILLSGTKASAPTTPVVLGTPLTVSSTGAFTTSRQALKVSIPTPSPFDAPPADTSGNATTNDFALSIVGSSPINEGDRPRFGESGALPAESLLHYWIFGDKKTGDVSETNYDIKVATLDGAGSSALHRYASTGTYAVQVLVVSETGKRATASFSMTALNVPPVADAGKDLLVNPGAIVPFNGGASYAGDFDTLTYSWDVDNTNGVQFSPPDLMGVGPRTFAYTVPGVYTATLHVCDDDNTCADDTVQVTVNDFVFTLSVAYATINEGENASFQSKGAPAGEEQKTKYYWLFGTGKKGIVSETNYDDVYDSASDPRYVAPDMMNLRPLYGNAGTYDIAVIAVSASGKRARAFAQLQVANVPPTANAGRDITVRVGQAVPLNGSGSYAGDYDNKFFYWDVDRNDGLSFASDLTKADLTGESPENFSYSSIGVRTATLRVCDDDNSCADDTVQVTVNP